jgi:hypothetical protein
VFIRTTAFSLSPAKHTRIPVETFQVQHLWRQRPMPRLMHSQDAVHALDGTAGPHRLTQHRRDLTVRFSPVGVQLFAENSLHQASRMAIPSDRCLSRFPRQLPPQPPQLNQGLIGTRAFSITCYFAAIYGYTANTRESAVADPIQRSARSPPNLRIRRCALIWGVLGRGSAVIGMPQAARAGRHGAL